jgi:hypothetical protein
MPRGEVNVSFLPASLPHLPQWKLWRTEVEKRIEKGGAKLYMKTLRKAGCGEDELLFRLAAVLAWHGRKEGTRKATGLTLHQLKMAPRKLRDAAKLIGQLQRTWQPTGEAPEDENSLINSLKSYADELESWGIQRLLKPSGMTLELAALCSLVDCVKKATGKNHDEEVSALIAAVLGKDNYFATHLTQWRSKHKAEIELNRSVLVNPLTEGIPKK